MPAFGAASYVSAQAEVLVDLPMGRAGGYHWHSGILRAALGTQISALSDPLLAKSRRIATQARQVLAVTDGCQHQGYAVVAEGI